PGANFAHVREAALRIKAGLDAIGMPAGAKTSGSGGIHVSVPIVRGPTQHEVWRISKSLSVALVAQNRDLLTSAYAIADRPAERVLVDYNQNAWGRTLASAYSVRPLPQAPVSTPVLWAELSQDLQPQDFRIDNVPARVALLGDLWAPLAANAGRYDLGALIREQ
ncbi:MAG: hypothetical protein KGR26_07135, partial [Cyanobacteria bacterium REEB65]|nr:hypothetical protein [Cyanobacteria bacterium REEB65]